MSKLAAAIPKDLISREVNDLTIDEIKEVVKNTGLSKLQAFYPEKKKYELELEPTSPRWPPLPDWGNEKKKVEYEVPFEFFKRPKVGDRGKTGGSDRQRVEKGGYRGGRNSGSRRNLRKVLFR